MVWTITANGHTNATRGASGSRRCAGLRAAGQGSVSRRALRPGRTGGPTHPGRVGRAALRHGGRALTLTLWTEEVSVRAPDDMVNEVVDVGLSWFKHQGPAGEITVDPRRVTVEAAPARPWRPSCSASRANTCCERASTTGTRTTAPAATSAAGATPTCGSRSRPSAPVTVCRAAAPRMDATSGGTVTD